MAWRIENPQKNPPAMILVDTSIIVAWLDPDNDQHAACKNALAKWSGEDELAVSSITYAELASGGRSRLAVDELLVGFKHIDYDFDAAFRAGQAFRRWNPGKSETPVLPDFLIRGQAAILGCRHLTNDRGQLRAFPEVDFLFPED